MLLLKAEVVAMEMQLLRTDDCVSQVITKYADMVFRLCFVYLKNKADAEDAFQDIFLKLYEKNLSFNDEFTSKWSMRYFKSFGLNWIDR